MNELVPLTFQIILILSMFILTLIFVLFPLFLIKCYLKVEDERVKVKFARVLSCLTMFVCGTFIGLAFLDMLPDVVLDMNEIFKEKKINYPLGEFMVSFGLMLMIVLDQVFVFLKENEFDVRDPISRLDRPDPVVQTPVVSTSEVLPDPRGAPKPSAFHVVILFLSLACHSLFEGFVVTTQSGSMSEMLTLYIPIIFHKLIVAFGLGLNSAQCKIKMITFILLSIVFSAMSPFGMICGTSLHYILPDDILKLVSSVCEGLACGSFLYVVCFNLIPRELEQARFRLLKLVMMIFGFAAMAVFIYITHVIEL